MNDGTERIRTFVSEMQWPALPSPNGALVLSLLHQLEHSEFWTAEQILANQLHQLTAVLRHARETVPYYRSGLRDFEFRGEALSFEDLRALPFVSRRDLQVFEQDFHTNVDLAKFGNSHAVHTSGSTGEPVKVHKTRVDQLMWEALTLREHSWHRRDPASQLAAIRITENGVGAPPHGSESPTWGPPAADLWVTGQSALLSLATEIGVQFDWLMRRDAHYLLTFPSNLSALLEHGRHDGRRPARLKHVRTVGESVSDELRAQLGEQWGVPLVDIYISNELGYLALQCPVSDRYHVMSESVLLEVLDEDDEVCKPGEIGRIVATSLHNFAMPLIRYELGDYAQQGEPCPCGRGLPTLDRIVGRVRNLVTLPNGERHWPLVGFARFRDLAPIVQYQLAQISRENIEVRLVVERALKSTEEASLTSVIRESLGYPFSLSFHYYDGQIPRRPGDKFEEFVSLI